MFPRAVWAVARGALSGGLGAVMDAEFGHHCAHVSVGGFRTDAELGWGQPVKWRGTNRGVPPGSKRRLVQINPALLFVAVVANERHIERQFAGYSALNA